MTDLVSLAYSGERISFFQLFTQKKLVVEIPIIQRDYAQGREKQSAVREAFLTALFSYLEEGKTHRDLDFVYGSVALNEADNLIDGGDISGRFIPLDGQQRLTTLFLLHWYLGQISGKAEYFRTALGVNGRSRFTYKTRSSSREFCDALLKHDLNLEYLRNNDGNEKIISATIQDASWFYLSWSGDPTIRAMLNMLDAIHQKFKGCADFFERLVDEENPVITFLFLNLHEFNLTDDLYIKMNARGKPLTHFENFKARLEKKLKSFGGPWPVYKLKFRDLPVGGYEYFIHKIDTDWADIFWDYRNESSDDNTYDDELMNFIAMALANCHLLQTGQESKMFGSVGVVRRLSFMEYEGAGCLTQGNLAQLITQLDLLGSHGKIKQYLDTNPYYDEEKVFKKIITNTTNYSEKLRFYAFYELLARGFRDEHLLDWMRVIFNLTENTPFNTLDNYYRALKSLRDLIAHAEPIHTLLKRNVVVLGFTQEQILEEKIKAHLLTKSPAWKQEILKTEAHPYFEGQIGFILKFSGIVDYYNEHFSTDWGDSDVNYFKQFCFYAQSSSAVFSLIAADSRNINYAWERAVLSKGFYMNGTTVDRFNLLSARGINNIDRDHSWKRLLRPIGKDPLWDQKQSFVKAVFDDPDFSTVDVKGALEVICAKALNTSQGNEWRMLLIEMPQLFTLCRQGFIVHNNHEIVLLHESQRNHYHSELFSKYLELKLLSEKVNCSPFERVRYIPSKTSYELSNLFFEQFHHEKCSYRLTIWYESNQYKLAFRNGNENPFSDDVSKILESAGFFVRMKADSGIQEGFYGVCDTPSQTISKLASLFESLRELKND
ncbi:DUF262 domain-containing protein [Undibacterium sp. Di24W]|uniref:DUF262 domain-containing protein n=1 Tax=Undibacterium sp. Di24W TaxID=3413033 RepID=UPI003BF57CAE